MDDKLTHYGILGMKWGKRRFQNRDGSLTAAGRKRYEQNQYETPEEFEARKKKAVEGGSAAEVLKFRGRLTNAELQAAKTRIGLEKDLENYDAKRIEDGHKKVKDVISYVETGTDALKKGVGLWNVVAQVNNAFNSKKKLPTIDTNSNKGEGEKPDPGKDLLNSLRTQKAKEILETMGSASSADLNAVKSRIEYEDAIKRNLFGNGNDSNNTSASSKTDRGKVLADILKKQKPEQRTKTIESLSSDDIDALKTRLGKEDGLKKTVEEILKDK